MLFKLLNFIKTTEDNILKELIEASYEFYSNKENKIDEKYITDILSALQVLFPDCLVEYKNQCQGLDGKWYDISLIDDMMKQFIDIKKNHIHTQKNIIIDWS